MTPGIVRPCAAAKEAKRSNTPELNLEVKKELRATHCEVLCDSRTRGEDTWAVGPCIGEDQHLDRAGRRNTFCPAGEEEGLRRQGEQQVQRGSVKGPGVPGGGEKFRDVKAHASLRVCACACVPVGDNKGVGTRMAGDETQEFLLLSPKRSAVL